MFKTFLGLISILLICGTVCEAQAQFALRSERELIGLLESNASAADKAIACKELAVVGTDASISPLCKLLGNPELSSWARIALEANFSAATSEALRNAAKSLEGKLQIGVINSIGARRDEAAVELLASFLGSQSMELAEAAAIALGKIGNNSAGKFLLTRFATVDAEHREALAQGCIRCADRLAAAGQDSDALALFDGIRSAEVSLQRRSEATRGTILLRKTGGLPLLAETLMSDDNRMFRMSLTVIRELESPDVAATVFQAIESAPPDRASVLIRALADRNDPEVLPLLAKTAENGSPQVRLAAVESLGAFGNATVLDVLMRIALERQPELADAALKALAQLPTIDVNDRLAALLPGAQSEQRLLLLDLVARRRIPATKELVGDLTSNDQRIYLAAVKALGETVDLAELPLLIEEVLKPRFEPLEVAEACRLALKSAAIRMPDQDACAEHLENSIANAPVAVKQFLLEVVAEVGGSRALEIVDAFARSSETKMQDTGSRLLGKWSSLNAAETILNYARTGPSPQYRSRALKGFISLARRFSMPEPDRVRMCRAAIGVSAQTSERLLVLDVLKLHPSPEAFALAIELSNREEMKSEALSAGIAIAQSLGGEGVDVDLLKKAIGGRSVKLEVLQAQYGAGSNWLDVTEVLKCQSNDSAWIALSSPNYNQAFGGDPAPGTVKRLNVQYQMDGKKGSASFAENELIILPDPK